jgi:hydrogenase expression/formation protein HypE
MKKPEFLEKGKLRGEQLRSAVLQHLPMLSTTPTANLDYSRLPTNNRELIISCDPIVGIPQQYYGFSAVHVPGADIAVAGVKPRFLVLGVYYPPDYPTDWLEKNMIDLGNEATRLGIKIVGGHTGGYDGLTLPLISSTCIGLIEDRLLSPNAIEVNDRLIVSGPVTHELAVFLSYVDTKKMERLLGVEQVANLKKDIKKITVIEPALAAADAGARAMHDIAEGGTALALKELSEACGFGIELNYDLIPWSDEGAIVTRAYDADPLSTSSFGSLLIAAPEKQVDEVLKTLRDQGRPSQEVGHFSGRKGIVVRKSGKETKLEVKEDIYGRFTPKL